MALRTLSDYRVLVVPGLHDSGPEHWQTRWQRLYPAFERVRQDHWDRPDLPRWSARLDQVRAADARPTLLVAHSFGCLTSAHSLADHAHGVAGVLFVAPADPEKFHVVDALPHDHLPCPSIMIASDTDPWMSASSAALWAKRWGSSFINGGDLGHINSESRLGDWLFGQSQLQALVGLAL
ncbi:RBBP9/YdeN family alpha/beta hydrolase [Janthinobacterium agaricidamnosum]|uniref:Alpha/beta hydrolase n=1 Tax=Janthinobacterium agaricidamnosum NBRC 102515 = DSM 9628 TaxID=1349767 RepID=W0V2F7_9BURK|nr:alpha/beta hydrolase [Janthinobacterium agaricidamnosum]CDG81810.1 conserved hypothetical protein [Janthinobacterium agaricidamnosum NBRC 102515 = DSM 9628]